MAKANMSPPPIAADEYVKIATASGDLQERMWKIRTVSLLAAALVVIGAIALIVRPEAAKEIWLIIGPILSGVATAYATSMRGHSSSSGDR